MSTNSQSLITFAEAKGNFFDRQVVQDALGREVATALGRVASYVRTTARRSMRPARRMRVSEMSAKDQELYKLKRDSRGRFLKRALELPWVSSAPGEPPRSRTKRLRNSIFYAFDSRSNSAVVGPIRFPGSRSEDSPSILEFGGNSTVRIAKPQKEKPKGRKATDAQAEAFKRKLADGSIRRPEDPNKKAPIITYSVRIAPRPYMRPALSIVRPRIVGEFRNLIR